MRKGIVSDLVKYCDDLLPIQALSLISQAILSTNETRVFEDVSDTNPSTLTFYQLWINLFPVFYFGINNTRLLKSPRNSAFQTQLF